MDSPLFAECGFGLAACDAACDEHSQRVDRSHDGIRVGQTPYRTDAVDKGPQQWQERQSYPFVVQEVARSSRVSHPTSNPYSRLGSRGFIIYAESV